MEYEIEDILILIKKKMREQGGYDRDSYRQYVIETVDYFIEKGKLSEEENIPFLIDSLLERWEEVEEKLASKES